MRIYRIGMAVLLAATLASCARVSNSFEPTPEEMRVSLLKLLKERPEISIPEFKNSLELQAPEVRDGIVYIGTWSCDPELLTFTALFSTPSISMYEISGRFDLSPAGNWVAIPWRVQTTRGRDVNGFWRASEIDTHWPPG
jgi:hypothetical protein